MRQVLAGAAALLGGCAATAPAPPRVETMPGMCDAAAVQSYIGQPATPERMEAARRASGATHARAIAPGAMVTQDYRTDRLSITLGQDGRITAIRCG